MISPALWRILEVCDGLVVVVVVNINEVLDGHVGLDIQCLDRIYLNAYVPKLQMGGQVVTFMRDHLGNNIPSPAVLQKIGTAFRRSVNSFAEANHIPLIHFAKGDRKIEVMHRYLLAQEKTGQSGVVAVGVAQEYQNVFASTQRRASNGIPWFSFTKADRRVTCFSTQAGIGFTALSNGFASCEDPEALQEICDRLGPGTIGVFFQRWMARLPLPLTDYDADAGYWWELSMRQIEVSRTLVFDAPRHARAFFESLVVDNLDLGRPETLELVFGRQIRRGKERRTQDVFNTKVVTRDTDVTINAFYKHSRIKQYLKDGRALRIETVVNSPTDLRCPRRLEHLDEPACSILNVSGRVVSLRAQPLSGSHSPPSPRMAGGPRPCGSATHGSWPCSAHYV